MKKWLAVGYFGHGNLGDEASLAAFLAYCGAAGIDVRVHTRNGKVRGFTGLFRGLKNADEVIFTGGNLLQNETSFASLLYYVFICLLAKMRRIPYVFLSSGIGPIHGKCADALCRFAIRNCLLFGARTETDLCSCLRYGCKNAVFMPDLCFLYPPHFSEKADCFAVIPKRGGALTAAEIAKIEKETGLSARILLFYPAQDGKASPLKDRPTFSPKTAQEAFSLLADCRFAISERLHGGILSLLSGTCCLLPADGGKCEAFVTDRRQEARRLGIPPPCGFLGDSPLPPVLPKEEDLRRLIAEKNDELIRLLSDRIC